ncbi:RRS1-domain-containing protein [Atractiella rhizophila]|nr:RRS1-domain-containing protein [Atractiella rhizophila]
MAAEGEDQVLALASSSVPSTSKLSTPHTISLPLLAIFDHSEVHLPSTAQDPVAFEQALLSNSQTIVQALVGSIFSRPLVSSLSANSGEIPTAISSLNKTSLEPLVTLPPASDLEYGLIPRAKRLPSAKPLTKWEKFAKKKGIGAKNKGKKVWDEEKGEWRDRWGYGKWKGARGMGEDGKGLADDWVVEVKGNEEADPSYNPRAQSKKESKLRKGKNEKQQLANIARAQAETSGPTPQEKRKTELERKIGQVSRSTTAMGKFAEAGEVGRAKGERRKFEPNVTSGGEKEERNKQLEILNKLGKPGSGTTSKKRKAEEMGGAELNVRKAIRTLNGERKAAKDASAKTGGGKRGKGKR